MKKQISRLVMIVVSGILMISFYATSSSALNLVNNGGFETGDFSGWTKSGAFIGLGSESFSGNYAAQFGESLISGQLSQTGIPTTLGKDYRFSFVFANPGDKYNKFEAFVNGNQVFAELNGDSRPYDVYSFHFTADKSFTEIAFNERNSGPGMFLLDDVSVTAPAPVPEPSTLFLLGIGLLGASFLKKRIGNA